MAEGNHTVEGRTFAHAGEHAEKERERRHHGKRDAGENRGLLEVIGDQRGDLFFEMDGAAPIARREMGEPAQVTTEEGVKIAVLGEPEMALIGRRELAETMGRDILDVQLQRREHDEGDGEHQWQGGRRRRAMKWSMAYVDKGS